MNETPSDSGGNMQSFTRTAYFLLYEDKLKN